MLRNHEINLLALYEQLSSEVQQIFYDLLCHPVFIQKLNRDYENNLVTKISRKEADAFLSQTEHIEASNFYSFIFMQDDDGIRTPYVIGNLIGRGANGIIKNAYNLLTGEHVALKIDRGYSAKTEQERRLEFDCEKDVLINYNHSFRDKLIRIDNNHTVFYLAEEFIPGESLDIYMHKDLSDTLASTSRASLKCVGIAKTVMEIMGISLINLFKLHHMDYVHRDVKPSNIMVVKNKDLLQEWDSEVEDARFIDFGGTDKNPGQPRSIKLGTFAYLAPELISNANFVAFTKKSDMYSLGKTFKELLDMIVEQGTSKINLFFRNVPDYKMLISKLKSFVQLMTAEDPQQRMDADTAVLNFYDIWDSWKYFDNKKNIRPDISLNIIRDECHQLALAHQSSVEQEVNYHYYNVP